MSFADLIKKGSLRQVATVTVATVGPPSPSSVATVATVSVATAKKQATNEPAPVQENLRKPEFQSAANDPAQVPERVAGDVLASLVAEETAVRKQLVRSEVRTETLVSNTAAAKPDPDRWCWPHSQAMTGREIDTMAERTSLFNRRGLPALDAERLADKLVNRDRDGDDRHLCVECRHCRPGLRCVNKLAVLHVLQRCDHFVPIPLS